MTDLKTSLSEAVGAAFAAEGVEPALARVQAKSGAPGKPDVALAAVRDVLIPGPGGDIAARVYTPQGQGPHPGAQLPWTVANEHHGARGSRSIATTRSLNRG